MLVQMTSKIQFPKPKGRRGCGSIPDALKLKDLQPKTIEAYAPALRHIGDYFDHQIDALTAAQLTDYFTDLPYQGNGKSAEETALMLTRLTA